jgi:acetylornithine deacetylase/succinyl-diaminopimelate desuccinylase-like protein
MDAGKLDADIVRTDVARFWDEQANPALVDYIRIPNKSPAFDADWRANGHMEQATQLYAAFAERALAEVKGATVEIFRLGERTPVILIDVPATASGTDPAAPILFYGHLDKQPEAEGWSHGMGPWVPVVKDDKLYGRGSADDGYAMFGALGAILAVEAQGLPHARCLVLIEACEESGSYDLPAYIAHLKDRLGAPSLVVCLDSGCGNYDQLWLTTSLRGMVGGNLRVDVLREGVHSGLASGIVPSSFRILRTLLSRLEDERTGAILPSELHAEIPAERRAQAQVAARALGDEVWSKFAYAGDTAPMAEQNVELLLNQTWRPTLSVTGLEGAPPLGAAGNVLRPFTAAKLSVRLPPTTDAGAAGEALKALLERDPPYGAQVRFTLDKAGAGWNAPPLASWLERALEHGSRAAFGQGVAMVGEGGSIPLMGMLSEMFPKAQFVITGVLGPRSNAHGPDEFLHIPMVKGVTAAMAEVVAAHAEATSLQAAA